MTADELIARLNRFESDGTERVHTFAGGGGVAIGADWDAAEAEEFIRTATSIGPDEFAGHVQVTGADGRVRYMDAK